MIARRWYDNPVIIFPAAAMLGVAFVAVPVAIIAPGSFDAERRLCDQAVEALLHSPDLVEVTRAGFIIRRLDCSIRRRLP